tara:strand:- start:29 stop:553 length:525 start_codon:yes stop_codon:yes gene_type:complete
MKDINSSRFGKWIYRCNGFQQHNKSVKEFIKWNVGLTGCSRESAKENMNRLMQDEVWDSQCGKFKVVKSTCNYIEGSLNNMVHDKMFDGVVHLSIRMNNGFDHLCDWRDFQNIKNDLVGVNYCAIEIYPPEEFLHDTDNVFHLWVFPEGISIPIGWTNRIVDYTKTATQRGENE